MPKMHPVHEWLAENMTADYAAGYTDAALGLGYQNAKQSPEYEDGFNAARRDYRPERRSTGSTSRAPLLVRTAATANPKPIGARPMQPKLGTLQVNTTDYDSIVIERFDYSNLPEPHWSVPAWEECGLGNLAGPFASRAEAQQALDNYQQEGLF